MAIKFLYLYEFKSMHFNIYSKCNQVYKVDAGKKNYNSDTQTVQYRFNMHWHKIFITKRSELKCIWVPNLTFVFFTDKVISHFRFKKQLVFLSEFSKDIQEMSTKLSLVHFAHHDITYPMSESKEQRRRMKPEYMYIWMCNVYNDWWRTSDAWRVLWLIRSNKTRHHMINAYLKRSNLAPEDMHQSG